jgi:hypothetical protein
MIEPGNQAVRQEFELPRRVARQPDTAAQGTGWFFRIPILTNASVAELLSRPRPASFPARYRALNGLHATREDSPQWGGEAGGSKGERRSKIAARNGDGCLSNPRADAGGLRQMGALAPQVLPADTVQLLPLSAVRVRSATCDDDCPRCCLNVCPQHANVDFSGGKGASLNYPPGLLQSVMVFAASWASASVL